MRLHPTSTRACRFKTGSGFTLVEMMIVVLVVSIISAMAVARLGNTSITKLKAAAQLLVADIGFAQSDSIGHGADLRVIVFNVAGSTYHIAPASTPDIPITHPMTKAPYQIRFGQGSAVGLEGVSIASVDVGGDDQLRFGVYGQLDQAVAATITLAIDGHAITITIDPITGEAAIGSVVMQ